MKPAVQTESHPIIVPAGEFKAKCLRLMDEANEKQQKIGVTKRGKLVGHFVPLPPEPKPFRSLFGRSPTIQIPDHPQWMKLKQEWTDEWDDSTKRSVRRLQQPKSPKR